MYSQDLGDGARQLPSLRLACHREPEVPEFRGNPVHPVARRVTRPWSAVTYKQDDDLADFSSGYTLDHPKGTFRRIGEIGCQEYTAEEPGREDPAFRFQPLPRWKGDDQHRAVRPTDHGPGDTAAQEPTHRAMGMAAHGNQRDTLLFRNSEDLQRRLPELQAATAADPGGLHLLAQLAEARFGVPPPGDHTLKAIRREPDLRAHFDHVQQYEFLDAKSLGTREPGGQATRLRTQVGRQENPGEDVGLLVPSGTATVGYVNPKGRAPASRASLHPGHDVHRKSHPSSGLRFRARVPALRQHHRDRLRIVHRRPAYFRCQLADETHPIGGREASDRCEDLLHSHRPT